MWSFQAKRNALHEQLLLAPEADPSEFIRRYLAQKSVPQQHTGRSDLNRTVRAGNSDPERRLSNSAELARMRAGSTGRQSLFAG